MIKTRPTLAQTTWPHWLTRFALVVLISSQAAVAHAEILSMPYPEPSTNGALHYNRAILAMSVIPLEEREMLSQPIWEAFGDKSKDEISEIAAKLVYSARHAIRAAKKGSAQGHAEFGIDYGDYGHGAGLPHADPMLQVGRLMTIAGIQAQIEGQWENAAGLFFSGIRLGAHMADQPSLVETLVGIEILENNYYALAFWAAKCPDVRLVKQAFLRFDIGTRSIVNPVKALAHESSIVRHQIDELESAFPDGPWSEMLLEAIGELTVAGSRSEHEAHAKQLCVDRGVPSHVFKDKAAFTEFAEKVKQLHVNYLRSAAICMDLPPQERIKRAKALMERYGERFAAIGDEEMLDAQQLASYFATYEADRAMARVAIAVGASRQDGQFPASLDAVAEMLDGVAPTSPYDGAVIQYELLEGGKDYSIKIPEATVEGVTLPEIDFSSYRGG